ncbi:MAG: SH3 domain-containing protein [Bacillota bacterium]|nr:SH3 domain-containing protein [Bacillota bacterium]
MKYTKVLLTLSVFLAVMIVFAAFGCDLDKDASKEPRASEEIVESGAELEPELEPEPESKLEVVVNVDVLRLRNGPSTDYEILDRLMLGTLLSVIGQENEWLKVITPEGKEGWVHGDYVIFKDQITSAYGSISGSLSHPASYMPSLRVVAFNLGDGFIYYIDTVEDQLHYQIDGLPPGDYHVVAYTESGYAGGYSQFVLDGLQSGFDDHTLLPVSVYAGNVTQEIDPADWYAPEGAFPPRP